MTTLNQLREQRNSHVAEMKNLMDKNTGKWDVDLQAKWAEHDLAVQDLDVQIANHQRMLDLEAENRFGMSDGSTNARQGNAPQNRAIFDKWLRNGDRGLSAEEWQAIRNTMSTTTDAEGGYTVQTEVAATILEAMKEYSGLRASGLCDVIQTTQGNPMSFPTSDGTAEEGEIVAENGSATDDDADFGVKSLSVYKFSSKVITVPIELIQDSNANVEEFVRNRIAQRLGRITEKMFTIGTGSGQPTGIVTAATVGVVAGATETASITYDQLIDLEHSVDPAYRTPDAAFMFNDSTLKYIRKIKDLSGRPIFVPGYETGIPGGAPSTLLGRRIVLNQHMASLGASNKPVAFGNLSYYKIRDVMQMTLQRYTDSAYAKKGQVGFMAWARHGGNLIDVGGAVKTFQNAAA